MNFEENNLKKIKSEFEKMKSTINLLKSRTKYLSYENEKLFRLIRNIQLNYENPWNNFDASRTKESFDKQWELFKIPNILQHSKECVNTILKYTQIDKEWFNNKTVLDAGCGCGRFSYAFLELGSKVKSIDISDNGILDTKKLCQKFNHNNIHKVNLLEYTDDEKFDMVWSYGVAHHTGNTYKALNNI